MATTPVATVTLMVALTATPAAPTMAATALVMARPPAPTTMALGDRDVSKGTKDMSVRIAPRGASVF
jgi:hypothetical protein